MKTNLYILCQGCDYANHPHRVPVYQDDEVEEKHIHVSDCYRWNCKYITPENP